MNPDAAAATLDRSNLAFERYRCFVAGAQSVVNFEGLQSVLFLARRGECTLRCFVTRQALVTYFGANVGDADAGLDSLRAYDKYALFIHGVVRRLIADDVRTPSGALVITADHVFRHLTTGRVAGAPIDSAALAAAGA